MHVSLLKVQCKHQKRTIHASALMSTNKGNLLTAAGQLDQFYMPKYESLFFCKTSVNVLLGTAHLALQAVQMETGTAHSFRYKWEMANKTVRKKASWKNQSLTHDHELSTTASVPQRNLSNVRIIINRCGASYKTKAMICLKQSLQATTLIVSQL